MKIHVLNVAILASMAGSLHIASAQVPTSSGAQFYAAPAGSPNGDGSMARPWDLATALSHPAAVTPGDTIWLRGGKYGTGGSTVFTSDLLGTSTKPIIVRQFPGERAIVDGGINTTGGYTWYWGFEITNSSLVRSGNPAQRSPGLLLGNNTGGNKAINLVIHDTGHPAIQFNNQSDQGEVYGCILWGAGIYDTANLGSTRSPVTRGDGIYAQNMSGKTYITDNIVFWNFTVGAKAYGEGGAIKGFNFEGNTSFENGDRGIFVAANTGDPTNVVEGLRISENAVYQTGYGSKTLQIGYNGVNKDAIVTDNYLVGADSGTTAAFFVDQFRTLSVLRNTSVGTTPGRGSIAEIRPVTGATMTWGQNTYHGGWARPFYYFDPGRVDNYFDFAGWKNHTKFDAGSTYSPALPTATKVIVRPNKYEPNRANITIFNWSNLASVSVNLSGAVAVGTPYDLYDVQNFFGPPVASGTYDGTPIAVPMNLTTVRSLVGAVTTMPNITHTAPRFAAFVLIPRSSAPVISAPVISPNGGSFTAPVTVSLSAHAAGASIHYTTDGSTPTAGSSKYSTPFVLTASKVVRAVAITSTGSSAVASASFTIAGADTTPPVISAAAAGALTQTSAVITWTTSEPADTQVVYGITASYGTIVPLNSAQTTVHVVNLSGLTPDTTYNYRARSRDAAGNLAMSQNLTFRTMSDTSPPVISSITATATTSSLTLTWTTNEDASSEVRYGTTMSMTSKIDARLVIVHSVTLTGLTAGTTYYYRIVSNDASGNQTISSVASARTQGTAWLTVTNVSVVPSATSAVVSFTTSQPAWCIVRYQASGSLPRSTPYRGQQTSHGIILSGLMPKTLYTYQIHCEDYLERPTDLPIQTFTTN